MADDPQGNGTPGAFSEAQQSAIQASINGAMNAMFGKVKGLLDQQTKSFDDRFAGLKPPSDLPASPPASPPSDDRLAEMQRLLKKQADMSAKLQADLERSESARKTELTNRQLTAALTAANAVAPEDALAVLRSQHEVRITDDGQVRIVDADGLPQPPVDFLATWLKSRPHLLKPATPGKGPGAHPIGIDGTGKLTREQIESMSHEQQMKLLAGGITIPGGGVFGRDDVTFKSSPPNSALESRRKEMGLVNVP